MSSPQPRREDWPRLARAIEQRVEFLGLPWKDIPTRGGPSTAKVREIINGTSTTLKPSLRRDLERVLEWPPKTIDVILAGGDPSPEPQGSPINQMSASEIVNNMEELVLELRRRITDDPEGWPSSWVPSQF